MKALIKYGKNVGEVGLREIEEPICGESDVKIEIKACAICVTDIHIYNNAYPWKPNVPLGHEFCGIIVEVGDRVRGFKVGDRVVACMDGGFARYVVKNENDWVFHLPDEISYEEGALLEPLCAAFNSVVNRSEIMPGDHVLIEGPGVMGLFALEAAVLKGARVMVSGTASDEDRLNFALELGAEAAVNVTNENLTERVLKFTEGKGMDTVIECSGSQSALDAGIAALRYDGQLTQVGIFGEKAVVDLGHLVYYNKKLVCSIAYDRATWERVIPLVRDGKLKTKPFISIQLPLNEWRRGFEISCEKKAYRVLLIP